MGVWKRTTCPECRTEGAIKFLWMVKCPFRSCSHHDASLADAGAGPQEKGAPPIPVSGSFDPGEHAVRIRYRNHAGEERAYTGDRRSVRKRNGHVSLRLAPRGVRCSFLIDRILNPDELEGLWSSVELTPVERQIVGYHRKHGTTSPRYEEILRSLGGADPGV